MKEYITIGTVLKPQGIRGEIKVLPITDDPNRFIGLKKVRIVKKDETTEARVMGARVNGNAVFLFLERVYDRDQAEALRGARIEVPREDAVPLPEGRYFIVDIIGSQVVDKSGRILGTLSEVLQPGANDVFVVKTDGDDLLIPAVDTFVLKIDAKKQVITVDADMLIGEDIHDD